MELFHHNKHGSEKSISSSISPHNTLSLRTVGCSFWTRGLVSSIRANRNKSSTADDGIRISDRNNFDRGNGLAWEAFWASYILNMRERG